MSKEGDYQKRKDGGKVTGKGKGFKKGQTEDNERAEKSREHREHTRRQDGKNEKEKLGEKDGSQKGAASGDTDSIKNKKMKRRRSYTLIRNDTQNTKKQRLYNPNTTTMELRVHFFGHLWTIEVKRCSCISTVLKEICRAEQLDWENGYILRRVGKQTDTILNDLQGTVGSILNDGDLLNLTYR